MDDDEGQGGGGNGNSNSKNSLTHRSSRYGASSPSLDKDMASNSASNASMMKKLPHKRTKQQRNTNNPPPIRYVLPCFPIRSTKSAILALIAACALFVSIMTSFLAYQSLNTLSSNRGFYSPSSGMILPSSKEWGAGRESRRKKRESAHRIENGESNVVKKSRRVREVKQEVVIPVTSQVYGAHLTSFYTKLVEEGDKYSLSFDEPDRLGQDMSVYANVGCSVFNKLYNTNAKSNHTASNEQESEDRIRRFWSSHLASVLEASRHADDLSFAHKNWTLTLLKSLSPYTLVDSLSSGKSTTTKDFEHILGIIVRRLLGLMHAKEGAAEASFVGTKTSMPPPLRIAVFGGPTVAGQGCQRGRGISRGQSSMSANPAFCAFPYRLEQFLNRMLLPPLALKHILDNGIGSNTNIRVVEVINLGEEGTYSDYSEAIARNRMYPPEMSPDLIIHAYSIDDYGTGLSEIEPFYAAVHNSFKSELKDGCIKEDQKPPPIILRALLESDEATGAQSADYIMTSILGEAVDDVEEGEAQLPTGESGGVMNTGGAFGMAGHVATSWALAFDLAHAALKICKSKAVTISELDQRPAIHKRAISQDETSFPSFQCDNGINPPCIFSILSGPKGNVARPSFLLQSITPFVVENTGWSPSSDMTAGFSRKTGIVANARGATMTLLFRNITRPVRRFDVLTLRSTSQIWKDGAAQFVLVTGGDFSHGEEVAQASAESSKETSFEISAELIADGEEDTHVTYHFGVDLLEGGNAAEVGTDVLLRIILTKGDKFKILGLMLCE
ncbi:hypothetical protein HJC23_005936 [Cyclotella cryptica]|uniref:Uncharacterized protein n=1 Tax=Cyclotella cryptica TaxID=29204 RepID=A0ABD3QZC3_9STRA